ncbi:MAG: GGDEF domain-containing protein [Blautia sp.]|nr:GGDEF domain-containing protein [Blautia sp.]
MDIERVIEIFLQRDLKGILVTDAKGRILYEDAKSSLINMDSSNWEIACPPAEEGQKAVEWELMDPKSQKAYMIVSSTFETEKGLIQIHHLTDVTICIDIYRNISAYSKSLREEKEHDNMTSLLNKGKFLEYKRTLFRKCDSIAIFNMDINNLKQMNDTLGHSAGDLLIKKAADSLLAVTARNILAFRVGGDEFYLVALHLSQKEAEELLMKWQESLDKQNRKDDGIICEMACGMAFAEKEYDLESLLETADQRMYEDKRRKKES